jgi:hypothetical protein
MLAIKDNEDSLGVSSLSRRTNLGAPGLASEAWESNHASAPSNGQSSKKRTPKNGVPEKSPVASNPARSESKKSARKKPATS